MRAFAFLLILILLAAIVIGVAHVITTMAKKRKLTRDPWEIKEISENDCLNVYAVKEGQDPVFLGGVAWSSPDFDYKIEEVRSDGNRRIMAANSGKPRALTKRELSR